MTRIWSSAAGEKRSSTSVTCSPGAALANSSRPAPTSRTRAVVRSRDITSPTSRPLSAPRISTWDSSLRAADWRNQPRKISQRPLRPPLINSERRPSPIIKNAQRRPSRAAPEVARYLSPLRCQSQARSRRPPSSGNAGMRLKSSSIAFVPASHAMPPSTRTGPAGCIKRERRGSKQDREGEADKRPGDRDLHLSPRDRGVAPQARDAAEDPERDAVDLHTKPPGDDGVTQLVTEQRHIEKDDSDHGDEPVGGLLLTGRHRGQHLPGEGPHDE